MNRMMSRMDGEVGGSARVRGPEHCIFQRDVLMEFDFMCRAH